MARESAAQKKAREAEEAQQATELAGDGDPVPAQVEGAVPAGLDLSKFVNPDAAPALAETTAPVAPVASPATATVSAQAVADAPAAPVEAKTKDGDSAFVVVVDSIGLAPAQCASRGETILLDASRAQRLLSLKAVRPA